VTKEQFIVVDVETSGPNPGAYSLLSIGACTLRKPRDTFYIELIPDKSEFVQDAMDVNKLSLAALTTEGISPEIALSQFVSWVKKNALDGQPIFTAFNAPFDWMFMNDYFHRYLKYNPFGHKALDIKALFMGKTGCVWSNTSHKSISKYFGLKYSLTHHALKDALLEADLLEKILNL
jgi:DNA polymerase III epsilon subunit-like protein